MRKIILLLSLLIFIFNLYAQDELQTSKLTITKNTDGGELLKFNTDRPWSFYNIGTGISSTLRLASEVDQKTFEISNLDGTCKTALFCVSNDLASSLVYLVPNGGKVGVGGIGGTSIVKAFLDVSSDISNGKLGTVFGRLSEGNSSGDGTFIGVRGYGTQLTDYNGKSFSIEHSFYGQVNSSINFYRGRSKTGGFITFNVNNNMEVVRIKSNGDVGIGTDLSQNINNYKLAVNGTIGAKEVKVEITSTTWSDFVFNDEYKLKSLKEVEDYINEKNHLPDIPTTKEVEDNGVNLGEMNSKLLQKIEELTLYMIEQNKKIEDLQNQINELKK